MYSISLFVVAVDRKQNQVALGLLSKKKTKRICRTIAACPIYAVCA